MKQKGLMKKLSVVLLGAAMIVSTFPQFATPVFAEGKANASPDIKQFATVEDLKNFDTDLTNGTYEEGKIYFGKSADDQTKQPWWIAGSQNGNLTLFAAYPLILRQQFESDKENDKAYSEEWKCDYYTGIGGTAPADVYPNHYGASSLRKKLKELETSCFTSIEQDLMNPTTIYTSDAKNDERVYSTEDKLYLPYADYDCYADVTQRTAYLTVGKNRSDDLKDSLRVDQRYWTVGGRFWLRAPNTEKREQVITAGNIPDLYVPLAGGGVAGSAYVLPAFELDLSEVAFASAVAPVSHEGPLKIDHVNNPEDKEAFTLRYRTDDLGSALVSYDKSKVTLTDVPSGAYLVVQNSNGAFAKRVIDGVTSLDAKDMGYADFANCRVWVERTDVENGITYATLATEEKGIIVYVTPGKEMAIVSKNGSQEVAPNTPIQNITVRVKEGYCFPENYELPEMNGLTVNRNGDTELVISGTPTADVHVTLNPATRTPASEGFVTVDELKNFDTITATKNNMAKVYFGNNKQRWWIVGSQNDMGLTLFAASPLEKRTKFNSNTSDKTYGEQTVHSNHYGASEIRNTLKGLETNNNYFSTLEQQLMNETRVHTNDMRNNSVYSTTDKLYLAYGGDNDEQYITVGTNEADNNVDILNDGLHIDIGYWGDDIFWLRTPIMNANNFARIATPDSGVFNTNVNTDYALIPAFELKLSNVNFASAAPAASSTGTLALQDTVIDGAYTLRYKTQKDIGTVTISQSKQSAEVTGIANDNTYLVVQNKDGAWSKKVAGNEEVFAKDMDSSLTSFVNCKVWLETTDTTNRITYATLVTEEAGTVVNITSDTGLSITSKNGNQGVLPDTPISDITVEAADGYYLPDDYISNLSNLTWNGLQVTANQSGNGFTISGTPTSDVNVILPAATPKAEQIAPNVTGGIGLTINDTTTAMEYASSETASAWTTCADGSTEVGAGTWYVRFRETDTQKASPTTEVVVTAPVYAIKADSTSLTFDPKNEGYGTDGLSQNVIITNTGNSKVTLENPTSISYDVSLSTTTIEPNGTAILTVVPNAGLTAGSYTEAIEVKTTENTSVSVNVAFAVNGALKVSLTASETNIIEGGSAMLTANAEGGSGTYSYTWYVDGTEDTTFQGKEVTVTPAQTTTYKVEITDTIEKKSAVATITVTPKKYELELPEDFTFDDRCIGYEDASANSFNIKNTGNVEVSNISAGLAGANADAFILDTTEMQTTLAPTETTTVTVKPNADLAEGTYTAQLEITGETGVAKTCEISFTVGEHKYQWVVDQGPTETEKGSKHEECSVCGDKKASVEIPVVPPTDPDKPNTDQPNTDRPNTEQSGNRSESAKTGDRANLLLWGGLLLGSSILLLCSLYRKKRSRNK